MLAASNTLSLSRSRPQGRGTQLAAVVMMVGFLSLWHLRVSGHLSWSALAALLLFVLVCLAYGQAFLTATASVSRNRAGLPFQFLSGFFVFNTLLFLVSLLSPLGMLFNVSLLALGALVLMILDARRQPVFDETGEALPGLLCILVAGLAATLWCSDAQAPLPIQGQAAVYQTWQDSFFHVRQISAFAQAHGIGTVQNIKMSGAPAQIYHFASYLSTAAVSVLTGAPAIDVYASFQLPFGIFLVGLAAFSLVSFIWGAWPALAAALAVLLLPDAYQQGFANRYLSYNFLAQVNLGMLYGIACAAIAWVFILEGSRRGKIASILVAYLFLAICLFYKAHVFVANAFLILIYPCLFFSGARLRWRLLAGGVLTGIFVAVVGFSQSIDGVPVLRLDGSGIGHYIVILLRDFDEGYLKAFFTQVFTLEKHAKPVEAMYVALMLLLSTFGLWLAATLLVVVAGRAKACAAIYCFPLLIIANYLVMSIGLALDTRGVGTPDELMNRPLAWAYFAVVAWTAGGAYYLATGSGLPRSRIARSALLVLSCLALTGPLVFAKDLQTYPARKGFATYGAFNAVPLCLVQASRFIRDNSRREDIIQDSENDPRFVVTALAERQLYAGESIFGKPGKKLQERLDGLVSFQALRDAAEVKSFAGSNKIDWYILQPGTPVAWPSSFIEQAVFNCDGYRIFRFTRSA